MAPKIEQEVIDLYDRYTHQPLPRREFMEKLTKIVGGSAAAVALMPYLENNYAQAAIVDPKDVSIATGYESYALGDKSIRAYVAAPKATGKAATVLVVHENRGLNPHIEDVTRRLAKAGFLAVAPDALSLSGGTPEDQDEARAMIKKLDMAQALDLYRAGARFADQHAKSSGKTGCVGFCWGGAMANQLSAHCETIDAAVAYYGRQLSKEEAGQVKAPLLLHYAGLDQRINTGITDYVTALLAAGKEFSLHLYPEVNHAFNNDTNAARYNQAAADLAWNRTLEFLKHHLEA